MTDCRLSINSEGKGWRSDVSERAKIEINKDCARIEYTLDGDYCVLSLSHDFIEQTRRGETDISMSFRQNDKTLCIIGDNALRGGFEIFCTKLKCTLGAKGVDAHIEYLSGEDREKVSVRIRALVLKDNFF